MLGFGRVKTSWVKRKFIFALESSILSPHYKCFWDTDQVIISPTPPPPPFIHVSHLIEFNIWSRKEILNTQHPLTTTEKLLNASNEFMIFKIFNRIPLQDRFAGSRTDLLLMRYMYIFRLGSIYKALIKASLGHGNKTVCHGITLPQGGRSSAVPSCTLGQTLKGEKEKEEKNRLEEEFVSHFALYLVEREVSKIQLSSWKFQMAKHLTHR